MTRVRALALALISACAADAFAASFDCARAAKKAEKLICADPSLSDLDEHLAAVYRQAAATVSKAADLRKAQRTWLGRRDACSDATCIATAYHARIDELEHALGRSLTTGAIAGEYERDDDGYSAAGEPASITVKALPDGRVAIAGEALWIGNAETGNVHTGTIEGEFDLRAGTVAYHDGDAGGCRITLRFTGDAVDALESGAYCGGMNVRFSGHYVKLR